MSHTTVPPSSNVLPIFRGKAPAAASPAPAIAPPPTPVVPASSPAPKSPSATALARNAKKYHCPKEAGYRRKTAWVAAGLTLLFLVCAIACLVARRSVVLLPFGSGVLVESALAIWKDAYVIAAVHNLVLSGLAAWFLIYSTYGHVDLPLDPRLPDVRVWRRQERFTWPEFVVGFALLIPGLVLHVGGHPWLGALLEGFGFGFLLHAMARQFVAITQMFLVVVRDTVQDGLGSAALIGGGTHGLRHGLTAIRPEDLIASRMTRSILESCVGLAGLRLEYRDHQRQIRIIHLRALGSPDLVQWIDQFLKVEFKIAKTRLSLDTGIPLPREK